MEKKNDLLSDLIEEACKVYEIPRQYVFASKVYPEGEVVIVTHGGKKFRHRTGEPAKFALTEIEITGQLPKQEMVWDERSNQKNNLTALLKKVKDRVVKQPGKGK